MKRLLYLGVCTTIGIGFFVYARRPHYCKEVPQRAIMTPCGSTPSIIGKRIPLIPQCTTEGCSNKCLQDQSNGQYQPKCAQHLKEQKTAEQLTNMVGAPGEKIDLPEQLNIQPKVQPNKEDDQSERENNHGER